MCDSRPQIISCRQKRLEILAFFINRLSMSFIRKLRSLKFGNSSIITKSRIDNKGHAFHQIDIKWTISNFPLNADPGKVIRSPYLELEIGGEKDKWQIVLYPGGYNNRVSEYVSVWLKKMSSNERLVRFTCIVLDSRSEEILKKTIQQKLTFETVLGWSTLCHLRTIGTSGVLVDGDLNLSCVVDVFEDLHISNAEFEENDQCSNWATKELALDFEDLLGSPKHSDFTIVTATGDDFKVNKCILSARSSVFRTMFQSEVNMDYYRVKTDDISSATMREMLRFIYSGRLGALDLDMAGNLLYAADKYDMYSLQKICSKVLVQGLSKGNAIRFLLLSDRHHDEKLKSASIAFIADNFPAIRDESKKEMQDLMECHSELFTLVLDKL